MTRYYTSLYDYGMGKVPEPETERNEKLAVDYLLEDEFGGWRYTIKQLGVKYARKDANGSEVPLTAARIHQILNKMGIKKNRRGK